MQGTCLTLTPRYFLIDYVKSEEVLTELSEGCYCNLSVLILTEQALITRHVLFHIIKFFLIWTFDSSFGHMHNYTTSEQLVAMLQAHLRFSY